MGRLGNIDWYLFLPAAFLTSLGGLTLSSVARESYPGHLGLLFLSLATFLFFARVDLRIFKKLAPILYIFSLTLLSATLFFGSFVRGASRWISLGPVSFQPSEITKPLLLIFFAYLISERDGYKKILLPGLLFIPAFLLIYFQPDLGSSAVLLLGFLGVLFFGGLPLKFFALGGGLSLLTAPLIWNFLEAYQKQRIMTFLSPVEDPLGTGYNAIQAVIAVGSGGLMGRGLGQGTQSQLSFLPERHTDFIYAALSEEWGFWGAALVILAFSLILWRLILILQSEKDLFLTSLVGGIFCVFFAHAAVNIGMNLGLSPVTGIPLPFVSSGGSALLSMSAMLGIASKASDSLKKNRTPGIMGL